MCCLAQGDEARTVIYSTTASDVTSLSSNPDFYLAAARANVAFSRAQVRVSVEGRFFQSSMLCATPSSLASVNSQTFSGHC